MELVYLWVEKYKNIENQGFNFSPRFTCKYDKDKNEITIEEKKDYVSIFPPNINVTAIVGENGSGKSTLIEIISLIRFEKKISKTLIVYQHQNTCYIFSHAYMHNFSSFDVQLINKTSLNIQQKDISPYNLFNLSLFNNQLSDFTTQKNRYWYLKTNHYEGYYNGLNKLYSKDVTLDKEYLEFNSKFYSLLTYKANFFDFLDKSFFFNEYRYELDFHDSFEYSIDAKYQKKLEALNLTYFSTKVNGVRYSLNEYNEIYDKDDNYKQNYLEMRKLYLIFSYMTFYFINAIIEMVEHFRSDLKEEFIDEIIEEKLLKQFSKSYEIWENAKQEQNLIGTYFYEIAYYMMILLTLKKFLKEFKEIILNIQEAIAKKNNKDMSYLTSDYLSYYAEIKYINHMNLISRIIDKNFTFPDFNNNQLLLAGRILSIHQPMEIEKQYSVILKNKGILNQNFLNSAKNCNFNLLSGGEKQFIKFFTNISYTLLKQSYYEEKQIVFLDEIELSFHPNWQKLILKNLIDCIYKIELISQKKVKYHLIYITHSPFILSDIPKGNVIFLEKGEQVNPFNDNEQTFGANIHTLLSHGFFMDGGLMGEFAKNRITKILNFLNGKCQYIDTPLEKIKPTIQIIGEDFLREKLLKMYEDKFPISKEEKIKQLEDELKRLKHD